MTASLRRTGCCLPMSYPTAFSLALPAIVAFGCTTGASLKKEVVVIEGQLDRAWGEGAYRCAAQELATAETELVFVRAELDQGNPVRAARHRRRATQAMLAVIKKVKVCPSLAPDRDQDGVIDDEDRCPDVPGLIERDGCPDSDGDGIVDAIDQCPEAPEDIDGQEDEDGCPESEDRDKDTVFDPDDECPDTPGAVENKGCPYGDIDQDGLSDDKDQCPKAPEDVDAFEDGDGCPDPDNDKDGIPDDDDRCPLKPETVNGFEDEDGCPDVKTDLVKVNRELGKIEIKQKVYFSTGRSLIRSRSNRLLDEVADVLKANTSMTVMVEGHTDAVGSSSTNLRLSQRRADAVRDYLIRKGVEPERLTAIGFGEEKPIDSNRTRRGRERNRRVEFTITAE